MTIFDRIIAREIPADIVHEDEHCIAFKDINPQAPTHLLIIPKTPIERVALAADTDATVLGHLLLVARDIARTMGIDAKEKGFRLVINNGNDGGEEVPHLHIHLLAGRQMKWPPG